MRSGLDTLTQHPPLFSGLTTRDALQKRASARERGEQGKGGMCTSACRANSHYKRRPTALLLKL